MGNHNLITKEQKNRHLSRNKQAAHQFGQYRHETNNRKKRREFDRQKKKNKKIQEKQAQQLQRERKMKPLRQYIQEKMRLVNNSSTNTTDYIAQNKIQNNNSRQTIKLSRQPKFRRKLKRINPTNNQTSFNSKFLLFLALSLILLPIAGAKSNSEEIRGKDIIKRYTSSGQTHNPDSAHTIPFEVVTTPSFINNSAPVLTNLFSSPYALPVKQVQSLHECHLLWSRSINDIHGELITREKLCLRKLSDPNSTEFHRAIKLGAEACMQKKHYDQDNIVMAWPKTKRIDLIKEIHRQAKMDPPQIDSKVVSPTTMNDLNLISAMPHHREVLSAGSTIPELAIHVIKFDTIPLVFEIIPDSANSAYYELQQDLLECMELGHEAQFAHLNSLGVNVPKLLSPLANPEYYPHQLQEFESNYRHIIEKLINHYSALSVMVIHAPPHFVQFVVDHSPPIFDQKVLANEIVTAAAWGIEDVLKILCNRPTSEIVDELTKGLIYALGMDKRENIIRFLFTKGVDLQKTHLISDDNVNYRPLFSYILSYCNDEYIRILIEHCPKCVREYAEQTGTSLLHKFTSARDIKTVKIMLEHDPSLIELTDEKGRKAIELIDMNKDHELAAMLQTAEKASETESQKLIVYKHYKWFITIVFFLGSFAITFLAIRSRSVEHRLDKNIHKLLAREKDKLQLLTNDILTNRWIIEDHVCKLNISCTISSRLLESAKKLDSRLHTLKESGFKRENIKSFLVRTLNELYGANAVSESTTQVMIEFTLNTNCDQFRILQAAKQLKHTIIHATDAYQALLLLDKKNKDKTELTARKAHAVSENHKHNQAIENQSELLNKHLNQFIDAKHSAMKRQSSVNITVRKFANNVVMRYETLEQELADIQKILQEYNDTFAKQLERFAEIKLALSKNDNLQTIEQQRQIILELENSNKATMSLLTRLNMANITFASLEEAIKSFKISQSKDPKGEEKTHTVPIIPSEHNEHNEQNEETKHKEHKERFMKMKSPKQQNTKSERIPTTAKDKSSAVSTHMPLSPANQRDALQATISKPESKIATPEIILIPGKQPLLPFFSANRAEVKEPKQPEKSDRSITFEQNPNSIFFYKPPEQPSKLNPEEIKNRIKFYGENISVMVATVHEYDFNNITERGIYRYALSYNLLRMFHCMWLETMIDNDNPALEESTEEPKQVRLIRHMLAHLPNAASEDILFSTALDIRTHFLSALLTENKKPANHATMVRLSKKEIRSLASRCNFNSTDLYHTLKEKWDNDEHRNMSSDHCCQEIQAAVFLISQIIKSIRSSHQLFLHPERLNAIKMLITIIGEYLNVLKHHHSKIWEAMLEHDKANILNECIRLRNRVCHFVHSHMHDIECTDVFQFAYRVEKCFEESFTPLIRRFAPPLFMLSIKSPGH